MKKNDLDIRDVWRGVFRITDTLREQQSGNLDRIFCKITCSQVRMIRRVYLHSAKDGSNGISLKNLAEQLGITPAAASEMVETLVQKGVLQRNTDSRDRRAVAIQVSDELRRAVIENESGFDNMTKEFLVTLDQESRDNFIGVIKQWMQFAEEHSSIENQNKGCDL